MRCDGDIETEEGDMKKCPGIIPIQVDISKIKVKFPEDHQNTFILDKDKGIGIKFKYPTIDTMKFVDKENTDDLDFVIELVESVFDKDNVYPADEVPREEIVEFVENISSSDFINIKRQFFDSMPFMSHTVKYECPRCGKKGEYTFEGIADFF
jgi:hypothetical protein